MQIETPFHYSFSLVLNPTGSANSSSTLVLQIHFLDISDKLIGGIPGIAPNTFFPVKANAGMPRPADTTMAFPRWPLSMWRLSDDPHGEGEVLLRDSESDVIHE